MRTYILGVDIAKKTFDVALRNGEGPCVTGHFPNSPKGFQRLHRWLMHQEVSSVHACMEATGRYGHALAAFLSAEGHAVSMVNPARIRAYGQSKLLRSKTDKMDAKLIADFGATQSPSLWKPPSVFQSELQSLTRRLDALKQSRNQEENRLESGIPSAAVRRSIEDHIDFLDRQIDQLSEEIQQLTQDSDEHRQPMELLVSIPDVSAFPQARQLAAYAGLCPRQHLSGTSVRKKSRLAKTGNAYLRTAFYMPALAAMRCNPLIRPLVQRLREQGKSSMTIVGAVMRKLLHIAHGVLKTGKPFDPNYLSGQVST